MSYPTPGPDATVFVQQCIDELGASIVEGRHEGSVLGALLEQIRSREAMRQGLQSEAWRSAVEIIQGALLAADAGDPEARDWDDRRVDEALESMRTMSAAEAQRAFSNLGAAILRGAGSDFIDMRPPNDGGDIVSSWLSGALMLRRVLRRAQRRS